MEIQAVTSRSFGLLMRRNVSISRNRTKIERLLDWKEFTSKTVGRFSFQCLVVYLLIIYFFDRTSDEGAWRLIILTVFASCVIVYKKINRIYAAEFGKCWTSTKPILQSSTVLKIRLYFKWFVSLK